MIYRWKIVLRDALGNEYLVAFCKDIDDAKEKMSLAEMEKTINNATGELALKAVYPEWLPDPIASDYTMFVRSLILEKEWQRLQENQKIKDFFSNDHGRMREFYFVSKAVPNNYTIINFGCENNAQSYLFAQHKKYIAVDTIAEQFRAPGTLYYQMTANRFISEIMPNLKLDMQRTFAICSNVTGKGGENPGMLVRMNFLNMYTINNFKKVSEYENEK